MDLLSFLISIFILLGLAGLLDDCGPEKPGCVKDYDAKCDEGGVTVDVLGLENVKEHVLELFVIR